MDAGRISRPKSGHRKGKRAGRRARGIVLTDRGGHWYATGRIRVDGRSVRVRRSLGLAVDTCSQDDAELALERYLEDVKAIASGAVGRGDPVAIAATGYLGRTRERPLGHSTIRIVQELVRAFTTRRLNEIAPREWNRWLDGEPGRAPGRASGRSAATRERILSSLMAFLAYCRRQHGLAELPAFERDKKARNPNRRARRPVADLRPELVAALFAAAPIHLRAQLAVERSTGARMSSILYGCTLGDLDLAKRTIMFRNTKPGHDVLAVLDPTAVAILREYLAWRGRLHDRDGALFLTHRRTPYRPARGASGQNKTAFNATKRRAQTAILAAAGDRTAALRGRGARDKAREIADQAAADAALVGRVTQHWFRHLLAQRWRADPRAGMDQGGWLDVRSFMAYGFDPHDQRARLAERFDDLAPPAPPPPPTRRAR
jgi:site-specific recombinase XerD